jgi:hypothetical protein
MGPELPPSQTGQIYSPAGLANLSDKEFGQIANGMAKSLQAGGVNLSTDQIIDALKALKDSGIPFNQSTMSLDPRNPALADPGMLAYVVTDVTLLEKSSTESTTEGEEAKESSSTEGEATLSKSQLRTVNRKAGFGTGEQSGRNTDPTASLEGKGNVSGTQATEAKERIQGSNPWMNNLFAVSLMIAMMDLVVAMKEIKEVENKFELDMQNNAYELEMASAKLEKDLGKVRAQMNMVAAYIAIGQAVTTVSFAAIGAGIGVSGMSGAAATNSGGKAVFIMQQTSTATQMGQGVSQFGTAAEKIITAHLTTEEARLKGEQMVTDATAKQMQKALNDAKQGFDEAQKQLDEALSLLRELLSKTYQHNMGIHSS